MKLGNFYARIMKYSDRGKLHFGNIQMPLMIIISLGVYKDTVVGRWIFAYSEITIPLILFGFIFVLIMIGRYEYKFGLIKKQVAIDNENNPMLKEILESLKRLETKSKDK
jgi:hypothetical protein